MTSPVSYALSLTTSVRVLAVTYRAAKSPATAFPAELLDALAGYVHLTNIGFHSSNIILVGESAGAFALLALMRYLSELRADEASQVHPGMVGAAALASVRLSTNIQRHVFSHEHGGSQRATSRDSTIPRLRRTTGSLTTGNTLSPRSHATSTSSTCASRSTSLLPSRNPSNTPSRTSGPRILLRRAPRLRVMRRTAKTTGRSTCGSNTATASCLRTICDGWYRRCVWTTSGCGATRCGAASMQMRWCGARSSSRWRGSGTG